jgi:predicted transport protein
LLATFNRYDDHAVRQMQRNIELIRYRRFGQDLVMLDLVTAISAKSVPAGTGKASGAGGQPGKHRSISSVLEELDPEMRDRFEALRDYLMALGDDVQETTLRFYIAFKRIRNFACVQFRTDKMLIHVKAEPSSVTLERGFTRDVSDVGHHGTGDLEITLAKSEDLERAKPLIQRSYDAS